MERQSVLSIDYDQSASPWTRIIKIIAIVAVLYGASDLAREVLTARSILHVTGRPQPDRDLIIGFSLLTMAIKALFVVGAAVFLKSRRSPRLLEIAAWSWIGLNVLGLAIYIFRLSPFQNLQGAPYMVSMLTHSVREVAFPLLIILLLREFRKDQLIGIVRIPAAPSGPASNHVQTPAAALR